MYFTSGNDRAFEQPQPRPEQPDEAAPGLENSVLENPTSDNPTPGNPTLENPMQLNKDISSKEKTTTDVSITDSIPILSRPSPLEDDKEKINYTCIFSNCRIRLSSCRWKARK